MKKKIECLVNINGKQASFIEPIEIDSANENYLVFIKLNKTLGEEVFENSNLIVFDISTHIIRGPLALKLMMEKKFELKDQQKSMKVGAWEITHITANGSYCNFHFKDKTSFMLSKNLSEAEQFLHSDLFFRINRFLIVSILYMDLELDPTCLKTICINNENHRICDEFKPQFVKWYKLFSFIVRKQY
ncbi:MAG: LytTR family transcriptional regulator DNA-binding domain-containing protein [Bacteroidota bacterium]